ncbi:hypothetical protein K438DRAFT_1811677 [Mycena galopus ATCC 62051]|nr:hypothetical protein K438DRAFT_1811677 [Mycena galopus ATCC 62051]
MQEVFLEDNNVGIKYSSGWSRQYQSIYHGSAVMRTTRLGDSMSATFEGSSIKFMGAQGWNHGSFLVNLDGEETTVDGYCCGTGGGVPQVIQFEATGLRSGSHTLTITNLARGPHGTVLEVDALIVTPPEPRSGSYFSLAAFLIVLAFTLAAVRRRFVRIANMTSHQMLPIASSGQPNPVRATPAAVALSSQQQSIRQDKKETPVPYSDPAAYLTAGASGSSQAQGLPPHYTPQTLGSTQIDDELVERIAQRLARLVREDGDAPPTYETTTTA